MNVRSSIVETLDEVKSASVVIDKNEVIIIDEKPKTIYSLKITVSDGEL